MNLHESPAITPEAFWTEFSVMLRSAWNPQVSDWFLADAPAWTGFITKLLVDMATAFNCHADCEYWPRVDISYFDRCGGDWEEWSREVAIEIENNVDWTNEICKLLDINAGLKVVVAYAPDRQSIHNILDRFPAIYVSRKYVTMPCNWLFVFGPREGELADFLAFKFNGENLNEITGDTKIIANSQEQASITTAF